MRVAELWRFPVKSLQGEQLMEAEVAPSGLAGDRAYAIFDVSSGFGLTARRVPELLFASAAINGDGGVAITLPDGSLVGPDDDALSDWLGRRVALRRAGETATPTYEDVVDFEDEDASRWKAFDGAAGPFQDSARARVSLVSTATIGGWDRRRFRANVVLDGAGEDGLVGHRVALGSAVLGIRKHISRCVMVTRPQPGIERDLEVLKSINRGRDGRLAVGALVNRPGQVRVGDDLRVLGTDP